MNAIKKAPNAYKPPSRYDLGNRLLDAEFEKAQERTKYALSNLRVTKATVTADGILYFLISSCYSFFVVAAGCLL